MVENGSWKGNGRAFRILFSLEKKQTYRAEYLIAATEGMQEYARVKYNYSGNNFFTKPSCVDTQLFDLSKVKNLELLQETGLEDKTVAVYAGKFGGIYQEDEVFDLIKTAYRKIGERFRFLLLSNYSDEKLSAQLRRINIPESVVIKKFVAHNRIPEYMGLADFALTPVKPVPTKRYCTPIKDGEYWALGLPVIIPDHISDDARIIRENSIGYVLTEFSDREYEKAIDSILKLMQENNIASRIREIALQYRNFSTAENIYRIIYSPRV